MTNKDGTIFIVSIHDEDSRGCLAFDLVQILESIKDLVSDYLWVAFLEDFIGESIPTGVTLSFAEFMDRAHRLQQTIDGTFIGGPAKQGSNQNPNSLGSIRTFPTSDAIIAIRAVDSSFFEVISKVERTINRIRDSFKDIRAHDPRDYF